MTRSPDLDAAYALDGDADARQLYADWAESYDATFVQAMDFRIPYHVRDLCLEHSAQGPLLDIGAGTGIVGELLSAAGLTPVDALDLSPEMLAVAEAKNVYRNLIAADVTRPIPLASDYQTIVSSGTFTHGHVGPSALTHLLDVAAPGALFVLSINAEHYAAHGFDAALAALPITDLETRDVPIYGPGATGPHRGDLTRMTIFRKAA
ncbi:class I SAM-dependent DNA methyltransferase [Pseudaestuariivita sp.]|uniref:class I SAM-dependent DNA methyltransferase n=1 Tax=Pseudaestuariivita sp. TaxID=2211669 RepID=UPI0040585881